MHPKYSTGQISFYSCILVISLPVYCTDVLWESVRLSLNPDVQHQLFTNKQIVRVRQARQTGSSADSDAVRPYLGRGRMWYQYTVIYGGREIVIIVSLTVAWYRTYTFIPSIVRSYVYFYSEGFGW